MKTSNFAKLVCASLMLTVLGGCGKDEKKSSSAPAPVQQPVVNPVVNNLNSTGQQALQNLEAWYKSNKENSIPSMLAKNVATGVLQVNQNNCKEKTYLGFINIQTCFSGGINTPTITYGFVTANSNTSKSANTKLAAIFTATSGLTLVQVTQVQGAFGHPLYTVDFGKSNGHIVRYKIDTGLNSAFNPVEKYDTEAGKLEYVANPQDLR